MVELIISNNDKNDTTTTATTTITAAAAALATTSATVLIVIILKRYNRKDTLASSIRHLHIMKSAFGRVISAFSRICMVTVVW